MRKLKEKCKMSRTELREHIFRMLFRVEFNNAEEMNLKAAQAVYDFFHSKD